MLLKKKEKKRKINSCLSLAVVFGFPIFSLIRAPSQRQSAMFIFRKRHLSARFIEPLPYSWMPHTPGHRPARGWLLLQSLKKALKRQIPGPFIPKDVIQ